MATVCWVDCHANLISLHQVVSATKSSGLFGAILRPKAPKLHVALAQSHHLRENVRHSQVLHLVPILLDLQQRIPTSGLDCQSDNDTATADNIRSLPGSCSNGLHGCMPVAHLSVYVAAVGALPRLAVMHHIGEQVIPRRHWLPGLPCDSHSIRLGDTEKSPQQTLHAAMCSTSSDQMLQCCRTVACSAPLGTGTTSFSSKFFTGKLTMVGFFSTCG